MNTGAANVNFGEMHHKKKQWVSNAISEVSSTVDYCRIIL